MDNKLFGRIIEIMPLRSGTSKNGTEWKATEYVFETIEQYPTQFTFQVFGEERMKKVHASLDQEVTIHFNVKGRKYNGKYFVNIDVWRIDNGDTTSDDSSQADSQEDLISDADAEAVKAQEAVRQAEDNPDMPF